MNTASAAAPTNDAAAAEDGGDPDQRSSAASDPDQPPPARPASAGDEPSGVACELDVTVDADVRPDAFDVDRLRTTLRAALDQLDRPVGRLGARIVRDETMAALHERYSNIPGTTDVLTFDLTQGPAAPVDVDIVACLDEAARQAAAHGHAVERELLLYLLHGVLHCLGYDDHDPTSFAAMHAEEDRILEAIGVGRTFTPPTRGTDDG